MILSAIWSLHAEPQGLLLTAEKLEWQQPSSISDSFPTLISTHHWQFDYEATEKMLLKIKQKKNGELTLNPSSAKALEQAVSALPSNMSENELQRVELLVTKGLPGKAGQQLASVLTKFYHFQQASNIAHVSVDTKQNEHDKVLSFQQNVLRQQHLL
jgi:hypothetical protein